MSVLLRRLAEYLALVSALMTLGALCVLWTLMALPLLLILPSGPGARIGRRGIRVGFRIYVWTLRTMGAYRLDLEALRSLRDGPPVLLAPNHPTLIDALLIIACVPRVVCVMKSSLMNNMFLGAGARLARYIRHDPPRRMIHEAVEALRGGGIVLLFPEGTRSTQSPINTLQAGVGIIAKQAGVPVQTLFVETDSPFLSKGWPLYRRPTLPISYRMRLGPRLPPPTDVREFTAELERCMQGGLINAPQNAWIDARRHARRASER